MGRRKPENELEPKDYILYFAYHIIGCGAGGRIFWPAECVGHGKGAERRGQKEDCANIR